jgi:hypothetical protein
VFDHGWGRVTNDDQALARVMLRNARAARALSQLHESHPAYPETDRESIRAGIELMVFRAQRNGHPMPEATLQWLRENDPAAAARLGLAVKKTETGQSPRT